MVNIIFFFLCGLATMLNFECQSKIFATEKSIDAAILADFNMMDFAILIYDTNQIEHTNTDFLMSLVNYANENKVNFDHIINFVFYAKNNNLPEINNWIKNIWINLSKINKGRLTDCIASHILLFITPSEHIKTLLPKETPINLLSNKKQWGTLDKTEVNTELQEILTCEKTEKFYQKIILFLEKINFPEISSLNTQTIPLTFQSCNNLTNILIRIQSNNQDTQSIIKNIICRLFTMQLFMLFQQQNKFSNLFPFNFPRRFLPGN